VTFAPLVAVPLGLSLAARRAAFGWLASPWIVTACLVGGLAFTWGFICGPGPVAASLTLPWLGVTAALAVGAVRSAVRNRPASWADAGATVALAFIPVGAAWAVVSRAGWRPFGFAEPIVLLTAAHFHYAGFVLPLAAGRVADRIGGRAGAAALAGVALGMPAVATGITFGGAVEWVASWGMAAVTVLVGVLHLRLAVRNRSILLAVAGLSLLAGMALVVVYALGTYLGHAWLSIPQMVAWHGTINVFGFAMPALLGWRRLEPVPGPVRGREVHAHAVFDTVPTTS
jgi:hypothetical protein